MNPTLVVDASIAIKWVVEEEGTPEALMLRTRYEFAARDLLVAECANILWKKTQRSELSAADLAISLGHPAYDCIYLSLAIAKGFRFVTTDDRLTRRIKEKAPASLATRCISLKEASMS